MVIVTSCSKERSAIFLPFDDTDIMNQEEKYIYTNFYVKELEGFSAPITRLQNNQIFHIPDSGTIWRKAVHIEDLLCVEQQAKNPLLPLLLLWK